MADHQEASVTLPTDPVSVGAARRYAEAVLLDWGFPAGDTAADAVRLIVSELATNAVQHTSGDSPEFTVQLRVDPDERLWVGVFDSCPRWPKRLPAAVQQDNGRGLLIIRQLAAEMGGKLSVIPAADGGKTVWLALPLPWAVAPRSRVG